MTDSLPIIQREVAVCKKCRLFKHALHGVPGEGLKNAKIFFIGQAPGAEEDQTGKPFVGRAGRFLAAMIKRVGLKREDCFITSVVKHFPPKNRLPKKDEIAACKPYLLRQLALVNPKVVVLLGRVAQAAIADEPILKGKTVIKTVHPSAAMRFPNMRTQMEQDFKRLQAESI